MHLENSSHSSDSKLPEKFKSLKLNAAINASVLILRVSVLKGSQPRRAKYSTCKPLASKDSGVFLGPRFKYVVFQAG